MTNLTPQIENKLVGYQAAFLLDLVTRMCMNCVSLTDGVCKGAPTVVATASSARASAVLFEMDGGLVSFAYMTDGEQVVGPLPEAQFGFFKEDDKWAFHVGMMSPDLFSIWAGPVSSN